MPTFHVTDPSGTTYEVTGPDGSTEQDALAMVQKQMTPQDQQRLATVQKSFATANPIRQIGNVQRGAIDILGGGADLLARGANALGFVPKSNPGGFFAGPQDVEAQNAQARANVDQTFGPQDPTSLADSAVRGGAASLLASPVAPIKYLQAPSMLTRTVGAGMTGATAGLLQDSPGGDNAEFAKRKALQAGLGFAGGALAQPVAEAAVRTVASGINALANSGTALARNLTGANSIDQIVNMTRAALGKSGVNYDGLDEKVKQGLLNDVQGALKAAPAVNPGAVARQAAFRQEGFDPLAPWITRNPSDYTAVENLSHITGVGDPLMQKKAALDQHVMDRLNQMRGPSQDPQAAGTLGIADLANYVKGEQGKTNVLYNTFRDIAPDVKGDPQRFVNDVFGGLEGQMAGASLPPGLRSIVNDISAGKIPLTPSTLYQLQKMANGARGSDGSANYALGTLSRAIDREMGKISESVGPTGSTMPVAAGTQLPDQQGSYAADVLKMARAQHAQTMGLLEGSPLLAKASEGTLAPESFVDQLTKAPIDEVKSTWPKLSDASQAAAKAQVIQDLKTKAFGNASDTSGKPAAQATFVNYINDDTNAAKLKVVLGDDGYEQVKRLGIMLEAAKMQPAGSAVNNSKSGGAIVSAAFKLSNGLKDLGIWGGTPLSVMANKSAAQNAMSIPTDALSQRTSLLNPLLTEILARRAGRGASLLAGSGAYPVGMGLLGHSPQ